MSFADLDGLCLQRVLRFVTSALELARLDAVAKPQHGVTAVAESERRVRAMAIVAPAKRALRRGELRFSISPGFPYSQGPSGDEGAPDDVTRFMVMISRRSCSARSRGLAGGTPFSQLEWGSSKRARPALMASS